MYTLELGVFSIDDLLVAFKNFISKTLIFIRHINDLNLINNKKSF